MIENLLKPKRPEKALVRVRLKEIRANPYQPRGFFDEAAIEGLAQSIRENGLISPIALRRLPQGGYGLIAGERRLRALRKLGRTWTDAVVMEADEAESRALSLIENLQREGLNCLEEARAVRDLIRAAGLTQDAAAKKLGHSPAFVANRLRLLRLPEEVQAVVARENLSERHARALLALEGHKDKQLKAAEMAAQKKLSVKETEALVRSLAKEPPKPRRVKTVVRDKRMFVNALKDTVTRLTDSGVEVAFRVEESEETVDVIVSLPKQGR